MTYTKSLVLFALLCSVFSSASAKTWLIGPTRIYTAPSKVMSLVANGDTVLIDAGTYSGDVGEWTRNNLVIRTVGGRAHLDANGKIAQSKGIWVVSGNNTNIEGIEFSGATISVALGNNGAGIRQQGNNLTLRNCFFHDNQDGILGGGDTTSDVDIEACEFASNGAGDGYSHNMYITHVHSFTLKFCYVHEAKVGHNVKSRAWNNYILYNKITDGETGTASYDIDLPNGGRSIVLGNSIMKGPLAQNHQLIRYGEEGLTNPDSELFVINNTMLTELGSTTFVTVAAGAASAKVINNLLAGAGVIVAGSADTITNVHSADTSYFKFKDVRQYDYHLTLLSPALPGTVNLGATKGFGLTPIEQYEHLLDSAARAEVTPTIGAYRSVTGSAVASTATRATEVMNFPNPFSRVTVIQLPTTDRTEVDKVDVYDVAGQVVQSQMANASSGQILFDRNALASGVYFYSILSAHKLYQGRFMISSEAQR